MLLLQKEVHQAHYLQLTQSLRASRGNAAFRRQDLLAVRVHGAFGACVLRAREGLQLVRRLLFQNHCAAVVP